MTDTSLPYPPNSHSSFTLGFDLFGYQPSVSFFHRMNSTSGKDGAFVELSLDQGNSWILLHDTIGFYPLPSSIYGLEVYNLYKDSDSLTNGLIGHSGNDTGWVQTVIQFPCFAIKTFWWTQLRFTFISDSIAERKDGWIIDQIVIDNSGGCSDIKEFHNTPSLVSYPNPVAGSTVVVEAGEYFPEFELHIINGHGALVRVQRSGAGKKVSVDVTDLRPGLHTILLRSKDQAIGFTRILIR